MDATFGQAKHILEVFAQQDATIEMISKIINSGLLSDIIEASRGHGNLDGDSIRDALCLPPDEFDMTVNYDRTIGEMNLAGHYTFISPELRSRITDYADSLAAKRIPAETQKGTKKTAFETVYFPKKLSSFSLERLLTERKLRCATRAELQTFAETFPFVAKRFGVFTCYPGFRAGELDFIIFQPCRDGIGLVHSEGDECHWQDYFYLLAAQVK